jgi:hypothetical protein
MTSTLDDRAFFRAHPDRSHRCRLATPEEIEANKSLDPARLPAGCFVYALVHVERSTEPTTTRVFTVSDPLLQEPSEQEAKQMFRLIYLQLEQRAAGAGQ